MEGCFPVPLQFKACSGFTWQPAVPGARPLYLVTLTCKDGDASSCVSIQEGGREDTPLGLQTRPQKLYTSLPLTPVGRTWLRGHT